MTAWAAASSGDPRRNTKPLLHYWMKIYAITNKLDGKRYVGQTRESLNRRLRSHLAAAHRGRRGLLRDAIRNNGRDAFTIEQLQECNSGEEMDEAERRWIAELDTLTPHGYNIEKDGYDGRGPMPEATKAKLREAAKHRPPGWYDKVCRAARNRSPEWRRRLSEAGKGRKATPKQCAALAAGLKLRHINGANRGEGNGMAVLTWDKVAQIREMYATGDYSQRYLGRLFGVTQVTINGVVRHKGWKTNTPDR